MGLLPPPVVRLKRALHDNVRKSCSVNKKAMVGKAPVPVKAPDAGRRAEIFLLAKYLEHRHLEIPEPCFDRLRS